MTGTTAPVTDDERAELERLRAQVAEYEDIVRCLPIGFIFIDAEDRVKMANPLGAEIRCVGDRLGATVAECHPPGTHTALERVMQRFRDEPQLQEHPIVLERMHRYEVSYSRVARPDGSYRGILWLAQDISRRKQLERELLHAERLAGLGRMASKVAHDIKNPLNAIQGAAHYLERSNGHDPATSAELTLLIKSQVERISRLVTHLNELTRPFQLKLQAEDLGAVIDEQLRACAMAHPEVRWNLEVDPELPRVPCDRALVERLVCNAAENACQAMGGRGELSVSVRHRQEDDGAWADIELADSGPGFPPVVLQNLFQPFLTTRPDGAGLGLTIMREICLLHGGDVAIDSCDRGARVTATLSSR